MSQFVNKDICVWHVDIQVHRDPKLFLHNFILNVGEVNNKLNFYFLKQLEVMPAVDVSHTAFTLLLIL